MAEIQNNNVSEVKVNKLTQEQIWATSLVLKVKEVLFDECKNTKEIYKSITRLENLRNDILQEFPAVYDAFVSEEDHLNHRLPFNKQTLQQMRMVCTKEERRKIRLYEMKRKEEKEVLKTYNSHLSRWNIKRYTEKLEELYKKKNLADQVKKFKIRYKGINFEALQSSYDLAIKDVKQAIKKIFESKNLTIKKYLEKKLQMPDYKLSNPLFTTFDNTVCDFIDEYVDFKIEDLNALQYEEENETF